MKFLGCENMNEEELLKQYQQKFIFVSKEFFEYYLNEGNELLQRLELTDKFLESVDGQTALLFSNWMQMLHAMNVLFLTRGIYASQVYICIMWEIYLQIKFLLLVKEDADKKCQYIIISSKLKKKEVLEKYIECIKGDNKQRLKLKSYLEQINAQVEDIKRQLGLRDINIKANDWYNDFNNTKRCNLHKLVKFKFNYGKLRPSDIEDLLYKNLSFFAHGLCGNDRIYKANGGYKLIPDYWICNGALWVRIILIMYEDMYTTFKDFFPDFEHNFPRDVKKVAEQFSRLKEAERIEESVMDIVCKYI